MNYLEAIKKSFLVSLNTDPRSNKKLKVLHGFIAKDLQNKLGKLGHMEKHAIRETDKDA